uniref:Uncharacterized protein n=1 Tax=Oryza nivara TaxID=4536 RepID=A0A0E0GYC9_ORYNI
MDQAMIMVKDFFHFIALFGGPWTYEVHKNISKHRKGYKLPSMLRNYLITFMRDETPPTLQFEAKNILIIAYIDKEKALKDTEDYVQGKLLPFEINKCKSYGDSPRGYVVDMGIFMYES